MAQSEPVEVAVEIIDKFSDDLKELETKLEKIDGKRLDVELDIDDGGDVEKIKGQLKELEKKLGSTLDIDVKGFEAALAKKKTLEKDMYSTLHVNTKRRGNGLGGFAATGGNPKTGPPGIPNPLRNTVQSGVIENLLAVEGAADHRTPKLGDDPVARAEADRIINSNVPGPNTLPDFSSPNENPKTPTAGFMESIRKGTSFDLDLNGDRMFSDSKFGSLEIQAKGFDPDLFSTGRGGGNYPFSRRQRIRRTVGRAGRAASGAVSTGGSMLGGLMDMDGESASGVFGGIVGKLKKFRPTIRMWMNLIALLVPMLITLAGAAVGAAAAIGGIAVAGGAILGLGLLGYGENAAESMDLLKAKIGEVKRELFSSLKPAMKAFNPIADQFLSNLAPAMKRLVGPLTRLGGFEGFLGGMGNGFIDWVVEGLTAIADLRAEIEAIGGVLGSIFGDLLINLLSWGTEELHDNMGAFINLASILGSLIVILYNVSKAVSFALAPFAPLFKIIAGLSGLLTNKWVGAILSSVTAVLLLYGALVGLNFVLGALTVANAIAAANAIKTVAVSVLSLAKNAIVTATTGIATLIKSLYGVVAGAYAARGAVGALLAMTGIGAVLAIGGFIAGEAVRGYSNATAQSASGMGGGGGNFGGYGGGGGATINIYGDVGNSEYQKMKDNFGSMYDEQGEINDETEK